MASATPQDTTRRFNAGEGGYGAPGARPAPPGSAPMRALAQAEEAEYRENDDYGPNKPDDIHGSSPCLKVPALVRSESDRRRVASGQADPRHSLAPAICPSLADMPQHSCRSPGCMDVPAQCRFGAGRPTRWRRDAPDYTARRGLNYKRMTSRPRLLAAVHQRRRPPGTPALAAMQRDDTERPSHHMRLAACPAWHRAGHAHMSLPPNFANNALRVIAGRTESHHAR